MDTLEFARHFMDVLGEGDEQKARACMTEDARIWHNFDDHEQTVDENMRLLGWMKKQCRTRRYDITRLEEIEGGYLQQHILTMETNGGDVLKMHACVIVTLRGGKVAKIEEYLDPAAVGKLG